jgi:hypothetical protein
MNIQVDLTPYQETNQIVKVLEDNIKELEQHIDEYCGSFVVSPEDLSMISLFQNMLNDMYEDLEEVMHLKQALYN